MLFLTCSCTPPTDRGTQPTPNLLFCYSKVFYSECIALFCQVSRLALDSVVLQLSHACIYSFKCFRYESGISHPVCCFFPLSLNVDSATRWQDLPPPMRVHDIVCRSPIFEYLSSLARWMFPCCRPPLFCFMVLGSASFWFTELALPGCGFLRMRDCLPCVSDALCLPGSTKGVLCLSQTVPWTIIFIECFCHIVSNIAVRGALHIDSRFTYTRKDIPREPADTHSLARIF
jgi:hypothetical protein